jgi:membrane protease YdiL (CAAX protease family)
MASSPKQKRKSPGERLTTLFLLLALVYYLPPILLWLHVIPFALRFHILVAMTLVMAIVVLVGKFSLTELGFRKDTLKGSVVWNGVLSATFVGIMLFTYRAGWIRTPTIPSWNLFFVFYVFVSSPCQEFLFRSAMFAELNRSRVTGGALQILVSAVTYSFMHAFYNDIITLSVTLFMGIVWGIIYRKYPNVWGVALSHAVLGVVSILVGII